MAVWFVCFIAVDKKRTTLDLALLTLGLATTDTFFATPSPCRLPRQPCNTVKSAMRMNEHAKGQFLAKNKIEVLP